MWWCITGKLLLCEPHPVTAGTTGSGPAPPVSSHPNTNSSRQEGGEGELSQGPRGPVSNACTHYGLGWWVPHKRVVMGGREVAVPDPPPTLILSKGLLWMLLAKHAFCSSPVFTVSAISECSCRSCRHFRWQVGRSVF